MSLQVHFARLVIIDRSCMVCWLYTKTIFAIVSMPREHLINVFYLLQHKLGLCASNRAAAAQQKIFFIHEFKLPVIGVAFYPFYKNLLGMRVCVCARVYLYSECVDFDGVIGSTHIQTKRINQVDCFFCYFFSISKSCFPFAVFVYCALYFLIDDYCDAGKLHVK